MEKLVEFSTIKKKIKKKIKKFDVIFIFFLNKKI